MLSALLTLVLLAPDLPPNLAAQATVTASTQVDGKYAAAKAADGDSQTHWASAGGKPPQSLTLTWPQAIRFDTVKIDPFATEDRNLYGVWSRVEVSAGGQTVSAESDEEGADRYVLRFEPAVETDRLTITIRGVHQTRHYLGVDEVEVFLDADRLIEVPPRLPRPKPRAALTPQGREVHPCVYLTPEDVARARRLAAETAWGKRIAGRIIDDAAKWLARSEAEWRAFLPPPGACYAYGFTGSPKNGQGWGSWGGARCSWEQPGKVTTPDGQVLPNAQYPDDGGGYHSPDGRIHYFVGSWNAWVTEQWGNAIDQLADAYALTGDEKHADRAAFFLDLLASIYPESSSGSWDYPSSPPSGRFARPWYQVARVLVRYVEASDLIWNSPALEKPSLRPELEQGFPASPRLQQREVGTTDVAGQSRAGMSRRENISLNLIQDGSYYCYSHSFDGKLHNGHADYMRGALAGGALLGIPEYVEVAVNGPYSLLAMVANNCDRDGRYYETSLGYALHARELYLTFLGPLTNWRDKNHPNGYDITADARFRSFYRLPALSVQCAGHAPNFGDSGPDNSQLFPASRPYDQIDYLMAEELYASSSGAAREEFARILRWLGRGNVERRRETNANRWMLFHAEPVHDGPDALPPDLERQVFGSWFLGQKGVAILRDGADQHAQAAFLRYGPSLNHGDLDDLGLIYYAKGWQMTYEIGYGLGSTHTQVGWGSQTASHSIVTVDEQSQKGPGSGGSLHLFARLPGLKLVEASSPLSYRSQGVSEYRRTVAMIGEGEDQILVDLFRVDGGRQHDYIVGSQFQEQTVSGVELGAAEPGSLAGPDISWGDKQGPDADIIGLPNKPYWNPPPGNGYGFLYQPRRGRPGGPWAAEWKLGGSNEARFQVHFVNEPNTEAITAKAPGLYPRNNNASYAVARRRGDQGLRSAFASIMAPLARPNAPGTLTPQQMIEQVAEANREYLVGGGYGGYFFFRGQAPGDFVTLRLAVPREGEYELVLQSLLYPSYATVQVSLDGRPVGEPLSLQAPEAKPQVEFPLGRHQLAAGEHLLRVEVAPGSKQVIFGLQGLRLRPTTEPAAASPAALVTSPQRLAASSSGNLLPVALSWRRGDRE
ncbi:MAG: heparinase II/III family protein, partial [Armatimonadetes bacterium]|nr:heparinase II/III family protein [Armatimonadota bacterium]